MSLSLPVPVFVVDGGPLPAGTKVYWRNLPAGQRVEIERTFGLTQVLPGPSTDAIETLPVPSVLIVPALGGGRVPEAYGPELHRLSRKRYTLEVVRGLLG